MDSEKKTGETFTVGRLARRHGLSRSALLYYDRIGLLRPSGHAKGEYRRYSAQDDERLARICEYRRAGISLKEIRAMLDEAPDTNVAAALERRLTELNEAMDGLRKQRALVTRLLGRPKLLSRDAALDRTGWLALLETAGIDGAGADEWHKRFEQSAPEGHARFLRRLGLGDEEVSAVRTMAAAPHEILNLNKQSGRFMELFFKIYEGLNREGPGSVDMARKALELCDELPERPAILELGAGTGGGTLALAELTDGRITATEYYQPFLDRLMEKAQAAGVAERVTPLKRDMADLDFAPASFDLIWCEGAAYIMGFDAALAYWKQFLKPGALLVVSEAVWLSDNAKAAAPAELRDYWAAGYPAMRTAEENVAAATNLGYRSLGHFTLDDECWQTYYNDLERRLDEVEPIYGDDPDGRAIIDESRTEIRLWRDHPDAYGYEMHVLKA